MNYFQLLGLTPQFELDFKALEAAYFAAQRESHPDCFVGKPEAARGQALQRSVDINNAYHTLKDPLKRAQYLLHLRGIEVGTEHDTIKPSPALLAETMEWREQVEEASPEELNKLNDLLEKTHQKSIKIIANACLYAQWESMAQEVLRFGYIVKAQEAIPALVAGSGRKHGNE